MFTSIGRLTEKCVSSQLADLLQFNMGDSNDSKTVAD